MMFAQADIQNLPANWLKYMITFLIISVVLTAVVVGAVVAVLQYFQSKRAATDSQERVLSPQPFIVAMQKEFATKHEFDVHVAANVLEHNNLFSKIGGVERGSRLHFDTKLDAIQKAAEDGREKLHDRINDVLEAVSELRGTVAEMNREKK